MSAGEPGDDEWIPVEVVYALPDRQRLISLQVRPGTTMRQVVRQSGLLEEFPEIDPDTATMGIFGRVVRNPHHVVHRFDRVEIYRPLEHDPRLQRQERARAQRRGRNRN